MSELLIHPVILAGGDGTRLWPLSHRKLPKQFIRILGDSSLFQEALRRSCQLPNVTAPLVVSNKSHLDHVIEQAREIGIDPGGCILEPEGRNTAPALALAALWALHYHGDDCLLLAMPSDHYIHDLNKFREAVNEGIPAAEKNGIVTFGIVPTSPESGYGYLRSSELPPGLDTSDLKPLIVEAFVEKPDRETAEKFVQSEQYLWNSGIFMMRPSVWLAELESRRPDISAACRDSFDKALVDGIVLRPDTNSFLSCPSESIDYSIIEPLVRDTGRNSSPNADFMDPKCYVVPLDAGWSDIGSWQALWDISEKDIDGNMVVGDVILESTQNSIVRSAHRTVAVVGMKDVIVVETEDSVLVLPMSESQRVKDIVSRIKSDG
ncbi:mannose-1-phosphate guanylyltransferase/mannose-6-phosphate isomerase [SAR202 cluster bacterium AD-804-J14_MRT_500m]|nr:mannose-1-phosphate guanylyltransferase/mannose-6-phosphate isomerase [SAR202 cluster bacterium AD-804-J14_MRT_500m]